MGLKTTMGQTQTKKQNPKMMKKITKLSISPFRKRLMDSKIGKSQP